MRETTEQAVIREVQEELGVIPSIIRPLWLNQAFFTEDIDHLNYHELCIYFLMDITETDLLTRGSVFKSEGFYKHLSTRKVRGEFIGMGNTTVIENFINALKDFSANTPYIESVILVGSYARGTNKENSDLDIVIITPSKMKMVENQDFVQNFGEVYKKQTEYYGACTSIRVWYKNGQEVEFGIVEPSWIEKPLDIGTNKVLSDGYKIVVDKKDYFESLTL